MWLTRIGIPSLLLLACLLTVACNGSSDQAAENGNESHEVNGTTTGEQPDGVDPHHPQALAEDQEANVYIPADEHLVRSLRVGVVYNDEEIQVRYEFDTPHPSWLHDYLVYQDGEWQRLGRGMAGPNPMGLYEDRISMALDDGSVEGFDVWGGYVGMHQGVYTRTDAAPEEIEKFLAMSREGDLDSESWQRRVPQERIDALRDAGTFLQTWQWRAHRSNPIGYADPGYVLAARHSADGRAMYDTNWDDEANQPLYMYDPARLDGARALRHDVLLAGGYSQDDPYFLDTESALPFDPDHEWQNGDTLPRRYLQQPEGSRAALRAQGRYEEGSWRVRVTRSLEAPNPRDSKTLASGETYHVAFAVHAESTHGRWHYVSLPLSFSLDGETDVRATYVEGDLDAADATWLEVPLFYPGQVYLAWLQDNDHEVHRRYRAARTAPLDPNGVRELAEALAEHELAWLREMGISAEPTR